MTDYDPYARLDALPAFTLTSTDIAADAPLPAPQRAPSLGGGDVSPQLAWSGFPPETKSFAVTCFDPDAPTGSGFWHWAVFNVPAEVTSLAAGAGSADSGLLPPGAVTLPNEYRLTQYSGAEPPEGTGTHRYYFVVHAVDAPSLDIDAQSTPAVLGFNLHFHALARAILVATAAADD
ncbi:YbhB/YbcL family Raf kinase inhibitor-like protein [Microbacterium sp. STN6]|uniref:YbhB/YbcL family Raf kinase inhibitor-like protein n=1 Tax=Microbacterium sp. STN6 TaxID=2995588 RepID=UPI002260C453|nr:YbhB/YbcL family Raf kinase inhibitor-like protein [Microbacterium sp. STN6]MCX7522624.1 YbhB/YbcL family Raf kinase inhibitor-like protein [Microbacterium sp. STN6]